MISLLIVISHAIMSQTLLIKVNLIRIHLKDDLWKTNLSIFNFFLNQLLVFLVVFVICSMDGIFLDLWIKRVMLILFTMNFSIAAIYPFFYGENVIINILGYECVVSSWVYSTQRTLAIFFLKQTYSSIRSANISTIIRGNIVIKWK